MKKLAALLILLTVAPASSAEPLLSVDYSNSLRIPNRHVRITVDPVGMLTVSTESHGKDIVTRKAQIPAEKFKGLKRDLEGLDWKKISADKTIGLDGTSVRISYGKQSVSLWSPDYNTNKRGLSSIQKAIEVIFELSGLDTYGRNQSK